MSPKIILPKKKKLDDVEEIALPTVKCSFCGKQTTQGLKQMQLIPVKDGRVVTLLDGSRKIIPATMKKMIYYMCTECVKKGAKMPERPKRWR